MNQYLEASKGVDGQSNALILNELGLAYGNTAKSGTVQKQATTPVKFPTRLLATIDNTSAIEFLGPTVYKVSSERPPKIAPPIAKSIT